MLRVWKLIWSILTPKERQKSVLLIIISFLLSFFETIGVAIIFPFMKIIADPAFIQTNAALSWLQDFTNTPDSRDFSIMFGLAAFCIIIVSTIFRAIATYILTRFCLMRAHSLSSRLLTLYLKQPYVWFLSQNSSELSQNLLSEIDTVVRDGIIPAFVALTQSVTIILIVSVIFLIEPWIAVATFLTLGGVYLVVYMLVRVRLEEVGQERFDANNDRFKVSQEAMGGIKELKVMALEANFLDTFRNATFRMSISQTLGLIIAKLPRFALEAISFGGIILIALLMIIKDRASADDILPIFALLGMAATKLFPALQQMYMQLSKVQFSIPPLEELNNAILQLSKTAEPVYDAPPLHLTQKIEFRDVHFQYPEAERSALSGVSFEIPARTSIGIVGGTGAGKTTIVDLLLGLFLPEKGHLYVDDTEIIQKNVTAWRKCIGYVPQQIFLTDDTLERNIAFGVPTEEINRAAVENAAKIARLHDFIMSDLPQGYSTIVGERGVRLSGGQRQRIGIARALYHDPEILIFDEATSALDNVTERVVIEALQSIGTSKTVITVAHRLTTVEKCDAILMLENGKVIAHGPYDYLLKESPDFRRLVGENIDTPDQTS